jgi:uncharacterized protein
LFNEFGMDYDVIAVLQAVLAECALSPEGIHGVAHWARVLENGLRLGETTGANLTVVRLFAVLHDSRRVNEGTDPDHGLRAAEFAAKLRGQLIRLPDPDFQLLWQACAGHTHQLTHPDVTIQTCWDSDRLDLARVGINPSPAYLSTAPAKLPETLNWAIGRGSTRFIPEFVYEEWGIELKCRTARHETRRNRRGSRRHPPRAQFP